MTDSVGGLYWRLSPWDHHVHAFRMLGEIVSEAVCSHSALTNRLAEPLPEDRHCYGCLYLHGDDLATHHADARPLRPLTPTRPK